MFKIQRYDTEQESRQETGNELLTKINERVQLKRKRTKRAKIEQATEQIENSKEKEHEPQDREKNKKKEKNEQSISLQKLNKNEQDIKDIKKLPEESNLQLYLDKNSEENNVLHAFPEFEKSEQTQQEIATTKLLGIPNWLVHPIIIDPEFTQPIDHFSLGLSAQLIKRCKTLGIHECFAVQAAVIPILTRFKSLSEVHTSPGDICVSAPTGSGKTLAYVLPIIEILSNRIVTRLRALVVLPTRDLVNQVKEIFEIFCKGTSLKVGTVTGQQAFIHEQEQLVGNFQDNLSGGISKVDILIATPGRLIEHISTTKNFTLQHLRFLVIDEADRLLNQSYQDWLTHILRPIQLGISNQIKKEHFGIKFDSFETPISDAVSSIVLENFISVPKTDISEPKISMIQKLLFSATLTRNPAKISSLRLVNPQYISVQIFETNENEANQIKYTLPSSLKEFMIVTTSSMKPLVVLNLLHNLNISSALCFTKSVDSAHRLSKLIQLFEELYQQRNNSHSLIAVAEYSSDLSLEKRKTILKKFKRGEIKLLISSDLIARGIDLDLVDTVINYDVPVYMKKYVHRVGRTARAGRKGYAYSLIESQEANHFKDMLVKAGHWNKIENIKINSTTLEPLKETYKESLNALKDYMTNLRSSVAKYQKNISDSMEIITSQD
ncbi:hypothetical protein Glove_156g55 [Diversispora epigaea]|uniref:ATP-dependent RNA helicase n=1 Tax=Diversispora epigaea TaxID=1348612 RepID=A0A397J0D3_9GLOM|nr:hypothetical protein Glove_156g55 [Diversispora epigaea]